MECLDYLQPGNVLMVADLARLGRSTAYLADIVTVLGSREQFKRWAKEVSPS